MARLNVEKFDYDWSRQDCWVSFDYKGNHYRFTHSVENAKSHGVDIRYGSDIFAQVVLSLEDIARMVERGIYDLSTWAAGVQYLPPAKELPSCLKVLQFETMPTSSTEIEKQFKALCKIAHPDCGGSDEQFRLLQEARVEALGCMDGGFPLFLCSDITN